MKDFLLLSGVLAGVIFLSEKKIGMGAVIKDEKEVSFKHTKEFLEIRDAFEKWIEKSPFYIGAKIERASKDAKHFYENGNLNNHFLSFLSGYNYAELNFRF